MTPKELISYANYLKSYYKNCNIIEIAKHLKCEVCFLNTSPKFITANTYNYKDGKKVIMINSRYSELSKNVLCAHELGHAILNHPYKNEYKDKNLENEYQANLFAVALLFDKNDFNMELEDMTNYTLEGILDKNIKMIG